MVEISVDARALDSIANKLKNMLEHDDVLGLEIHDSLARYCEPYTPFDTGIMSHSLQILKDGLRYNTPYAHYQYVGEVYGPNIPIKQNGEIVGWFSPPNQPKHPTGAKINYSKDKHPLATDHWDKAMMRDRAEDFEAEVGAMIERRIHNG